MGIRSEVQAWTQIQPLPVPGCTGNDLGPQTGPEPSGLLESRVPRKCASPVRRGAVGKGLQLGSTSLAAYPTGRPCPGGSPPQRTGRAATHGTHHSKQEGTRLSEINPRPPGPERPATEEH